MNGLGNGMGPMEVEDIKIVQGHTPSDVEGKVNRYVSQGYGLLSFTVLPNEGDRNGWPTVITAILAK